MKVKPISDHLNSQLGFPVFKATYGKTQLSRALIDRFGLQDATDETEPVALPYMPSHTYKDYLKKAVDLHRPYLEAIKSLTQIECQPAPQMSPPGPGLYRWDGTFWVRHGCLSSIATKYGTGLPPIYVMDCETMEVKGPDGKTRWVPFTAGFYDANFGVWYCWQTDLSLLPEHLPTVIPAEVLPEYGLIVGYNIPYDRQYFGNEYDHQGTRLRFFDLMAAHIVTRGQTNQQRPLYKKAEDNRELASVLSWYDETATNGLDAVYEFYTKKSLDKGVRNLIVEKGYPWILENLPICTRYCLADIKATADLCGYLVPELLEAIGEVALAGQLILGSQYLTLSADRWPDFYDRVDAQVEQTLAEVNDAVQQVADGLTERYLPELTALVDDLKGTPRAAKADRLAGTLATWVATLPWQLQGLDWTPATVGKTKGVPSWYRKGPVKLSSQITPMILGMQWLGKPVTYDWADFEVDGETVKQQTYMTDDGPIPHPEERGKRTTSLFSKGFVPSVETGALSGHPEAKELLAKAMSAVNWVSMRKRVADVHTEMVDGVPVCLPQIVVNGTITRRCKDSLWQVMANPKPKRYGTELKTMIEAPAGYIIVGADVDSEELWLASAMGDSELGFCGATPLGLMTLIGSKAQGTDVHSIVARELGISRDLAKNLVYGAIYGLGEQGAANYLMKSLPDLPIAECTKMAKKFIQKFKGTKSGSRYTGGLASEFFNFAERALECSRPDTPALGSRLTLALASTPDFKTTKVNWMVQASGSDFRDLYLVYAYSLFREYGVEARLLLSIHDEFRWLVGEAQAKLAALLLQNAHLMTRAYILEQIGLNYVPAGVAYHSEVDIDRYLRKSTKDGCCTPSQPVPLPLGKSYTPADLL